MTDNGKPAEIPVNVKEAAVAAIAAMLSTLPPGNAVLLVVHAPMMQTPGGGYGPDLTKLNILSPELPKFVVSQVESTVEFWADVARKQANASRLVIP